MTKHPLHLILLVPALLTAALAGCSGEPAASDPVADPSAPSADGAEFVLNSEPQEPRGVIQVREAAADGDEVVVVGRIGGSADPWIEGRAAFSIVDESLRACSDIPGDKCPRPWDYCCETSKLPGATALIKLVDDDSQLVAADARQLLKVEELSTVVVQGKARRDEEGNLTVLATGVYVRN